MVIRQFRLRVGIALVFLAVIVPMTAGMVGLLYERNARLAREMAEQAMELAAREVEIAVTGLIGDLTSAVELSSAFGRAQQDKLRRPESLRPLLESLERLPAAYSLYFGLQADGEFYQAVRLGPEVKTFGPQRRPPPEGAKWALRTIENSSGEKRDTYLYLGAWGKVVGVERADPVYDPRKRPWYGAALEKDATVSSGAYVFSGTGQPGITLSRRLLTDDGEIVGVFGSDLSIAALADFLKIQRVGNSGISFVLDEKGNLIGYPDPSKSVFLDNGALKLVKGDAVDNPAVASAIKVWQDSRAASFAVDVGSDTWLAHFKPFPEQSGQRWTIGVVVDEDDFVGPLKRTSLYILSIGLVFILLTTVGIIAASRLLVKPIHELIGETQKIRDFQLEGGVDVHSPVLEIDHLAGAIGNMKAGLSSFGSYVPKDLVKAIIHSGAGTKVGGDRRPLTVMFTDLQGFTQASEQMDPEHVLHWLSDYFDRMARSIHAHRGTIDKYIGDAVMAMWNAPLDDADHAANGCRSMLACRDAISGLTKAGGPVLRTRMGLHTGLAMVGNVGSSDRLQYTALGAMVNLASRVEGLNKYFGTELLVTDAVASAVEGQFLLRPFGPVLAVGTSVPVSVYELVAEMGGDALGLGLWQEAFQAFQAQDWKAAATAFQAYAEICPQDQAVGYYLGHATHFLDGGTPDDWVGIMKFSSK